MMSWKAYYNLARVGCSWAKSVCHGRFLPQGKPYAASIEPANYCNLHCRQCPTGMGQVSKKARLLELDSFRQFIDALSPELMWLNLYFQGEPLLNPALPEMVAYATQKGVRTSLSTNGMLLSDDLCRQLKAAGLHRLIVGIDGADAQTYSQYRAGGDFDRVVSGTQAAVRAGLKVTVQCLLLSNTVGQKAAMRRLCRKFRLGRLVFKRAQFYNEELMPPDGPDSRYRHTADGRYAPKKPLRQRCWRLFSTPGINTEGDVLACCFDKWHRHRFGNLLKQDFDAIWQGQARREFGQTVFGRRQEIGICTNCTE